MCYMFAHLTDCILNICQFINLMQDQVNPLHNIYQKCGINKLVDIPKGILWRSLAGNANEHSFIAL